MPEVKPQEGRKEKNNKFYTSTRWRSLRAMKLAQNPLCECCEKNGLLTPGRVVDHIIPINQGGAPLLISNLQTMCDKCHNIKSAKERHK